MTAEPFFELQGSTEAAEGSSPSQEPKSIALEYAYSFFKTHIYFTNKTRQTPLNSLAFVLFIERLHQLTQGLGVSITGVLFIIQLGNLDTVGIQCKISS